MIQLTRRRQIAGIILATAALLLVCAGPPASARKRPAKVCRAATLKSSSGTNLTRNRVRNGDRVIVVQRRGKRTYVVTKSGQGWIPSQSLCRAKKRKRG